MHGFILRTEATERLRMRLKYNVMENQIIQNIQPNLHKQLIKNVEGINYVRYPIKTHVVAGGESVPELIKKYVQPYLATGDTIFISEKMVAITQNRSISIKDIKPSWLAEIAVKYTYKNPGGLGIATPWTMQMVIKEAGLPRFLFASFASIITKPFGIKGMFYRVIGQRAKAIDGPIPHAIPPYNERVTLTPLHTNEVAQEIKNIFGHEVVIIDANDLGVEVLGKSSDAVKDSWACAVFKDNPLGQGREQTPLCIVRPFDSAQGK